MHLPADIDTATLATVIARATGCPKVEAIECGVEQIHEPFNQATGGVYRVAGTSRTDNGSVEWSLVNKIVCASGDVFGGRDDPGAPNFWAREPHLYESGLLEQLPGVRAPRCFRVDWIGASTASIWLEDVPHVTTTWTMARHGIAARRLGEFNGANLARRSSADSPFLSIGWHRATAHGLAPFITADASRSEDALVRRCGPGDLHDQVLNVWERRELLLDALDELPQTFCHLDAFSKNLFVDDDSGEVTAIDWSYAGIAPLGADLAPLVVATVLFGDAELDQLEVLEASAFDNYVEGLHSAGWDGDPATVVLGYRVAAAIRYGVFPMGVFLLDGQLRTRFERVFRQPAEAIADRWATISRYLVDGVASVIGAVADTAVVGVQ